MFGSFSYKVCAHCSLFHYSRWELCLPSGGWARLHDHFLSTLNQYSIPLSAQHFALSFRVPWILSLTVTIPINEGRLNFQSFLTLLYKMPASQGHCEDWMNCICKSTLWTNLKAHYASAVRLWLLRKGCFSTSMPSATFLQICVVCCTLQSALKTEEHELVPSVSGSQWEISPKSCIVLKIHLELASCSIMYLF